MLVGRAVFRLTQLNTGAMLVAPTVRTFSSEQVEEATIVSESDNAAEQEF